MNELVPIKQEPLQAEILDAEFKVEEEATEKANANEKPKKKRGRKKKEPVGENGEALERVDKEGELREKLMFWERQKVFYESKLKDVKDEIKTLDKQIYGLLVAEANEKQMPLLQVMMGDK
jgi:hypothetical protein